MIPLQFHKGHHPGHCRPCAAMMDGWDSFPRPNLNRQEAFTHKVWPDMAECGRDSRVQSHSSCRGSFIQTLSPFISAGENYVIGTHSGSSHNVCQKKSLMMRLQGAWSGPLEMAQKSKALWAEGGGLWYLIPGISILQIIMFSEQQQVDEGSLSLAGAEEPTRRSVCLQIVILTSYLWHFFWECEQIKRKNFSLLYFFFFPFLLQTRANKLEVWLHH